VRSLRNRGGHAALGVHGGYGHARVRQVMRLTFLCWTLLLAANASCGGESNPCGPPHSCAAGELPVSIDVPPTTTYVGSTNVTDVAVVAVSGPCEVGGFQGNVPYVGSTGLGVCRITVSFRSGAPDFVTDVTMKANPGPCCHGALTWGPYFVQVPDSQPADAATDN
jgi:hypothetical protein